MARNGVEDTRCISKAMLKRRSGEFDLESIFSLKLSDMGIEKLGCIGLCTALESLDLSRNNLSQLLPLTGLSCLAHLDLSSNRISNLEGLQTLSSMSSLNVAGNLIPRYRLYEIRPTIARHAGRLYSSGFGSLTLNTRFVQAILTHSRRASWILAEWCSVALLFGCDALRILRDLEKLTDLRMRDEIRDLTNPVCYHVQYKSQTLSVLPDLTSLDGERLVGRGSDLFQIFAEMDRAIEDIKSASHGINSISAKPEPWFSKEILNINEESAKTLDIECNSAGKKFAGLLSDCEQLLRSFDEKMTDANQELLFRDSIDS